jgi:hypothetical protein
MCQVSPEFQLGARREPQTPTTGSYSVVTLPPLGATPRQITESPQLPRHRLGAEVEGDRPFCPLRRSGVEV